MLLQKVLVHLSGVDEAKEGSAKVFRDPDVGLALNIKIKIKKKVETKKLTFNPLLVLVLHHRLKDGGGRREDNLV